MRKILPLFAALLLPLAACDNIYDPDDLDGSYEAVRVTLAANGQTRSVPGVIYEGEARLGGVRYDVRYELVDAQIDLDERTDSYTFTGVYRLMERNGRTLEVVTSTEYGRYDIYGSEISFDEDYSSDFFLDATGRISGRTIEIGVYDPIFEVRDIYQFRR